jgi:uncharacterized membrane protein
VRIGDEEELRVLFVQGALTWDYKFVGRALRSDPAFRLTGLTRTSERSLFRQNVETAEELLAGFPTSLEELSRFRVVVLSALRPPDMSDAQQELLARFVGELGGGLLLVGGASTFDGSWRGSRLEELLPVVFDPSPAARSVAPFRLELTDAARSSSVFALDDGDARGVWRRLPAFTGYGPIREAKPAATVWLRQGQAPAAQRIVMASQRYGAGMAAVLAVESLWRWRLARDLDPATFDRFWQQLFRFLGQSGSSPVDVELADQELVPGRAVAFLLSRHPRPEDEEDGPRPADHRVEVVDAAGKKVLDQRLELVPARPARLAFPAPVAALYTITVSDAAGVPVARRAVEVRGLDREMAATARDLDTLRQWASASGGLAWEEEAHPAASELIAAGRRQSAALARHHPRQLGLGGVTLTALLCCLGAEWALRRRRDLR